MGADVSELELFISKIDEAGINLDSYYRQAAKELASRLIALVVPRTVVGNYPKAMNRVGGTLRRGWVTKTHEESYSKTQNHAGAPSPSEMKKWARSLSVHKVGEAYQIEVVNPVEYASFIEYGHTMPNGAYYKPRHMMTISVNELETIAPKILEERLYKYLKKRLDV